MQQIHHTNSGYSIIAAVMMIGFLIVFCSGTLQLVLGEMQDGKGRQDYIKASYAAEGALELALFEVKDKGYGFSETKDDIDVLGSTTDRKTAVMSYEFLSRVQNFSQTLTDYETLIIPLFWIDSTGMSQSLLGSGINFTASGDVLWNIVGSGTGISGNGSFSSATTKKETQNDGTTNTVSIASFLSSNTNAYLQIYNAGILDVPVSLSVSASNEYFSLPIATIYSQGKIGKYSQNLETQLDNTEFLNILRYSIFSN